MTDRDVIQLFETHHPKSVEEIQALGVSCIYISRGCSRHVYRVGNLAVKIEHCDTWQTKKEIACMESVHEDPDLEKFLSNIPPLFYGSVEDDGPVGRVGVIVTKFYSAAVPKNASSRDKYLILRKEMESVGIHDLHIENFKLDENGTFVAIDLGYFNKRVPEPAQA